VARYSSISYLYYNVVGAVVVLAVGVVVAYWPRIQRPHQAG
jgi:hypothetical protein